MNIFIFGKGTQTRLSDGADVSLFGDDPHAYA